MIIKTRWNESVDRRKGKFIFSRRTHLMSFQGQCECPFKKNVHEEIINNTVTTFRPRTVSTNILRVKVIIRGSSPESSVSVLKNRCTDRTSIWKIVILLKLDRIAIYSTRKLTFIECKQSWLVFNRKTSFYCLRWHLAKYDANIVSFSYPAKQAFPWAAPRAVSHLNI